MFYFPLLISPGFGSLPDLKFPDLKKLSGRTYLMTPSPEFLIEMREAREGG